VSPEAALEKAVDKETFAKLVKEGAPEP
jgi:hypothetical protein